MQAACVLGAFEYLNLLVAQVIKTAMLTAQYSGHCVTSATGCSHAFTQRQRPVNRPFSLRSRNFFQQEHESGPMLNS